MQSYQLGQRFTTTGVPLNGGKAYFYLTTTTTPENVFDDPALGGGNAYSNPVVADSSGFFPELVYLDPTKTYRCVIKTSAGVTISDADPINTASSAGGIDGADINADSIPGTAFAPGAVNDALGYTAADEADLNVVQAITTALTGQVAAFAMSTAPAGWLECDGASVLRATYAALFTAIGTTWGSADGTHFNVPDLRGEFIRGWDHGKGTDSGRAFASSQTDEFEAHTHTTPTNQTTMNSTGGTTTGGPSGTSGTTTGSTGSTETRPRNYALMYCIKT